MPNTGRLGIGKLTCMENAERNRWPGTKIDKRKCDKVLFVKGFWKKSEVFFLFCLLKRHKQIVPIYHPLAERLLMESK